MVNLSYVCMFVLTVKGEHRCSY